MYSLHISARAAKNLEKIEAYLLKEWSRKVLTDFLIKTDKLFGQIAKMPYSFPEVDKIPNVRKALITKQNFLFYRIIEINKHIQILAIIDTRSKKKHPKKL